MGRSQWKRLLSTTTRVLCDEMTALRARAEREGLEATPSRLTSIEAALETQAQLLEEVREQARQAGAKAAHAIELFDALVSDDSTDY